jgi:capsular polysaccharide export protein
MYAPNLGGWLRFTGKKVLLLQGPHGPFFSRVAQVLRDAGARGVEKINFNGGDHFYFPSAAHAYCGNLSDWPAYLDNFLQKNAIDCILVFGDCRPIHAAACTVAVARGLQYWVFEEGYIRPNFITLEQHGVNAHSTLPTSRDVYDAWPHASLPDEAPVPASFGLAAKYAMAYFAASAIAWPWFWRYKHHRRLNILDGLCWVRSYWRKKYYQYKESGVLGDLKPNGQQRYFLVVLQVAMDAQITVHSRFKSISEFITDTMQSFAQHGSPDVVLLIKHHPMDRGYNDYSQLIHSLSDSYGLRNRVRYIHDQHLPTLLAHTEGVVTINSTVGLSALFHGTPVITRGKSVYSLPGLTCQDGIEAFWQRPRNFVPDPVLHNKFRNYVTVHTQVNGSFYVNLPNSDAAGVRWNKLPPLAAAPK